MFAIPPSKTPSKMTLVLDIDETLVHCCLNDENGNGHISQPDFELEAVGGRTVKGWERPGLRRFLTFVSG